MGTVELGISIIHDNDEMTAGVDKLKISWTNPNRRLELHPESELSGNNPKRSIA